MSTPFHRSDRAYCMDATGTDLRPKQLYHVNATYMDREGNQKLNLTGCRNDDWFLASRFVRVADPCERKWPAEGAQ